MLIFDVPGHILKSAQSMQKYFASLRPKQPKKSRPTKPNLEMDSTDSRSCARGENPAARGIFPHSDCNARTPFPPMQTLSICSTELRGSAFAIVLVVVTANMARAAGAIAMHGVPAMPDSFVAMPYVDPSPPKGGRMVQGVLGTFDNLNPYIVQGVAAQAARGYVIESLMARGYDEPFTLYGLVAQGVDTNDARTFVTFTLNPAARFSDGVPITADDIVFSWQVLRDHARPSYRTYYSKVEKAEILDQHTVRFDFPNANDRELPLILGLMPVLPKHLIDPDKFENASLEKPVGSGPYIFAQVEVGKSVTLKGDPNYWGRNLAINRGRWNFDELRFDFYRDDNARFEAFKAGLYDIRVESDPTRWQTAYGFPAVRDGSVVKESFTDGLPKISSDYVFNTRRPVFADIRVRQAIALLFDFEWINRVLFYSLYNRSASFFDRSELSAYHRPADARERALLAPFPNAVRADVLDGTWSPPVSDGSGRDRTTLHKALALLAAAGYEFKGTVLHNRVTGTPLSFEIMVTNRDDERLALAFSSSLARAGIVAYERANGYNYEAVKIFMPAGSKQPIVVHYTEHCPPDVGAAFIWLKNRDPERWRDVQNVEHVLGKYIISDKPMSEEQWAAERATIIDEKVVEELPAPEQPVRR
jgi:peptide/nickel transport system substrate-binding protein